MLALGVAAVGPEFLHKPSSQCEYLAFIERITGLTLSSTAITSVEVEHRRDGLVGATGW